MTCEVISEPQAAASLRDHGFCRCQWRTWQRPSTAVLGGAKRLLMAFHMFSVSLFHIPTAPNTETETFFGWSCLTWALFTPSQKVFGALGHVFKQQLLLLGDFDCFG